VALAAVVLVQTHKAQAALELQTQAVAVLAATLLAQTKLAAQAAQAL